MKKIKLTQGKVALVDDEDYDFINQWNWNVLNGSSKRLYANRLSYEDGYKNRKRILMHRLINKTPEGFDTDHINGNGLDNRKANLRTVTRSQNMWNRKPNSKGTSKHKGVCWHKQHRKWIVNIQVNNKRHFIGLFTDEDEAGKAYQDRAKKEFKKYNYKGKK